MFEPITPHLQCRDRRLDLSQPVVMGILNVTPDSFSDGGRYIDTDAAVAAALQMVAEGAALIDIGGESTRPGAEAVDLDTELARVIPVITALTGRVTVPLSIDTSKAEVMRAAVAAGAHLINDVMALRGAGAAAAVADLGVPVILMHCRGEPRTMQQDPQYDDVVVDVQKFLAERVLACEFAGISKANLVIDPGFGFGKTLAHNLALLRGLASLKSLSLPILVGLSRKRMFAELRKDHSAPTDRIAASLAGALIAVQQGALIVRTHDVAPTVQALQVCHAVGPIKAGAPAKPRNPFLSSDDE